MNRQLLGQPTAGVVLFGSNVSQKLSSSREELYSGEYDNFTRTIVLVLAHGSVGQVARTNFFEVMLRVRY